MGGTLGWPASLLTGVGLAAAVVDGGLGALVARGYGVDDRTTDAGSRRPGDSA